MGQFDYLINEAKPAGTSRVSTASKKSTRLDRYRTRITKKSQFLEPEEITEVEEALIAKNYKRLDELDKELSKRKDPSFLRQAGNVGKSILEDNAFRKVQKSQGALIDQFKAKNPDSKLFQKTPDVVLKSGLGGTPQELVDLATRSNEQRIKEITKREQAGKLTEEQARNLRIASFNRLSAEMGKQNQALEFAGDDEKDRLRIVAGVAGEGAFDVAGLVFTGGAANVAGQAGKQTGKQVLKQVGKKVIGGGVSGAGAGLSYAAQGEEFTAKEAAIATGVGAGVGTAAPLVGAGLGKVGNYLKKAPDVIPEKPVTNGVVELAPGKTIREGIWNRTKAKVNEVFYPIKNLDSGTQKIFNKSAGGRYVAKLEANQVVRNLKQAAKQADYKIDFDTALKIEGGEAPDNAFTQQFRETADKARQDAVDAGLDIGYIEDYVPHIWKQSPEKVDQIARSAGMKARAEGERIIPTYAEGIELGLKPQYKNPADMMGDYVKNLQTARTNSALVGDLKANGQLVIGKKPVGWKTITAEGFPRDAMGRSFNAPEDVARVINNLYGIADDPISKILKKSARFNSMWQDVKLAGGFPYTPANFFTFSQMAKEGAFGLGNVASGHPIMGAKSIYSPVSAFVRAFSKKRTNQLFENHNGLIKGLAKRGVSIQPIDDGNHWDKLFNEPTFGRFMPNLQLNTAKNIFNSLHKKLGRGAAMDETAAIMKRLYGITDQLATGRNQAVQDAIGTIAFAPKYREAIVGILTNTLKSLNPKNWADKSYSMNRRLAVGLGVTYMLYDQLNRQITGHGMNKNPEGKELQLAIPYGDKDEKGNKSVAYIPFMPSFLTIPRAGVEIVQGAIKGDDKAVIKGTGKFLSIPVQTISSLVSNQDYFERPIVVDAEVAAETGEEEDTALEKFGKRAGYVGTEALPAGGRAVVEAVQEKPIEQVIATGTEAPVRFGKLSPLSTEKASFSPSQVTGDFYKIYKPAKAREQKVSREITDLIKEGKRRQAYRVADEYNKSLENLFDEYYKEYKKDPGGDTDWEEMIEGLYIIDTKRAFDARERR